MAHRGLGHGARYLPALSRLGRVVPQSVPVAAQVIAQGNLVLPESAYPFRIFTGPGTLQSFGSAINGLAALQRRLPFAVPRLISDARYLFCEQLFQFRVPHRNSDLGGHLLNRLHTHADVKPIEYPFRWL